MKPLKNASFATIPQALKHVLADTDSPHVVVGPMREYSGALGFVVATSEKGRGFRCDCLYGGAEAYTGVLLRLALHKPPLTIHVLDDEVEMIRLCAHLWPGERVQALQKTVEAEVESWSATHQ